MIPQAVRVRSETGLTKVALRWIEQRYPEHMQISGAPIITERQPYGTRHVPGYSPWGGYDLSSTALDRPEKPHRPAARRLSAQFTASEKLVRSPSHRGFALGG